jgi:hypothetical protein
MPSLPPIHRIALGGAEGFGVGSELDSEFQVERSDRGFPPGPPILVHGAPLAAGADSSADQPPLIAVVATVIGFAAILIFAFSKRKARATTQEEGSDDEGTMLSAKARAQLILLKHDAKRKGAKKGNCNGKKVKDRAFRAEAAAEPTDDDDDEHRMENRMEQGSGRRREEKTSKAAASLSASRRAGTMAERTTLKKDTVKLSPRPSARPSAAEEPEQVEPPRRASKH